MIQIEASQPKTGIFISAYQRGFGLFPRGRSHTEACDFLMLLRENFSLHAEGAKYWTIDRIDEIAAELFSGKLFFVYERDRVPFACQKDGGRRSCRPGTYDGDIRLAHVDPRTKSSASTRKGKTEKSLRGPTSARRRRRRHSATVNARCTDKGASVRVITLRVKSLVIMRIP